MAFTRPVPWQGSYPPSLDPLTVPEAFPVHSIVEGAARQWADKQAVIFRNAALTYTEFKRQADQVAAAFLRAGLGRGTRIALLIPNSIYHLLSFFGAMKAGATIVHLSPLDSPRVMAHKLTDSGARVLVTTNIGEVATGAARLMEAGLVDRLIVGEDAVFGPSPLTGPMPSGDGIETLADFIDGADAATTSFPEIQVGDLALLQYTGGTTGMPKGAMLTHANLSSAVSSYDLWSDAHNMMRPGEERVLLFLPLFHIYALTSVMLRALRGGHTLIVHTRFDAETALAEIERGITSFPGVPTMWIAICAVPGYEKRDFSSLHYCASGGASLPVEIARKLRRAIGQDILGGWGMTETSPAGTNIPTARPDKIGTIGIPLPGIWLDIVALDDPAHVLGVGEVGEIRVFGPNVTSGYLNRPEETKASFSQGGLLTGDIGFMDEEGFFTIVDRKKDMIISGGFNVYPQMIEQAIYEHPDIEEVLVIGVPDPYRGEAAKAFVKLRPGANALTLEALTEFLKERVGRHEMPRALEIREALPRTPVGKLSKLELKAEERAKAATDKS